MKKSVIRGLLVAVTIATTTNISYAQTPFDSYAPPTENKEMLKLPEMTFRAYNTDTTHEIKYIELDKEYYTLSYFNDSDSLIKTVQLEPTAQKWWAVDPMAHKREWLSPYNFVQNNPINRIDPNGALDDWVESADGDIYWDDNATSQATTKEGETYLGKAVVVFNGSENESLGKGQNMYGEGANLASVTVYGPKGADDIQTFEGYTMSSDPEKFGVVDEGSYTVNRLNPGERKGPYNSDWVIESRSARIPAKGGLNPAHPERDPAYLNGVFIHRPNNNGWAGTFERNGKTKGVSEGCLLIAPTQWTVFENQLESVNSFHLKLNR